MFKKRHEQKPFIATEEQRRIVSILSGFNVKQDDICKLIPGVNGNKWISKHTLNKHFRAELETGNVTLKELIARKFVDALEHGEAWAIRLGLKNKHRWAIGDNATLPPEMLAEGDGAPEILINFVTPSRKEEPVNITPPSPYQDAQPDYNKPAIEPPRPRQRTEFGAIQEAPRPRHHPDYTSQTGEQPPSAFGPRGGPTSWMK
jgi:hypothetical protein